MNWLGKWRWLRTLAAVALVLTVSVSASPQHQGHDMSKMPGMNKPKPKPKTNAARKKRKPTRKKKVPKKDQMGNMPGMNMRAQPSSSPKPQASPQQMQMDMPGMQMPQASPSPQMQMNMPGMPAASPSPGIPPQVDTGPVLRLEELEQMALKNNPTVAQAEASIRVSQGRARQAGLFPNPVAGYQGEEFAFRNFSDKAEHFFFVEQTIPLGGKLSKARRVFARETDQAQALSEAQRLRVLNSVRILYFEAVGAQRLVDLRQNLMQLSREAVEITKALYNVGQADTPDHLEIEIEAQRAEIDLLRAQNDREQVWRALGAVIGNPGLRPARLAGSLEESFQSLDEETTLATLLRGSPEIQSARAGVERAQAELARARAQRIPDLFVRGGIGYSSEFLESRTGSTGRRTGAEANVQAGITVPIFNRNQGGIAAAEAELAIAERELQRLDLLLRQRFSSSFRDYRNAVQMAEKYRTEVVPRAERAYKMYLSKYQQMAAAYPQVLISQRTLFQVEVEYARSLIGVRQSAVSLKGFLLMGGLEPIGRPGEGMKGDDTEGFKLRAPNEATGGSGNP